MAAPMPPEAPVTSTALPLSPRSIRGSLTLALAEPLTAGVLGAVVLAEPVTGLSAAGGACVLAGLLALAVRLPVLASARQATA